MSASAIDRLRGFAEQSGRITASDERLVASELHMPVAAVHGAATFFDDLAPTRRGRRHVRVCEGTACFAADRGQHINEVEQALGVTTGRCREDGAVSLQAVRCIGFCYAAPALLDGDTPHADPDIADQLRTEQADDPPPIPVTASAEPVLLGGILSNDEPENVRSVVATCTTPAAEGMVVYTDDPVATSAVRGTLELLVSSLPARALDLPAERSELVRACEALGVPAPPPDGRTADRVDHTHPYVQFDPD